MKWRQQKKNFKKSIEKLGISVFWFAKRGQMNRLKKVSKIEVFPSNSDMVSNQASNPSWEKFVVHFHPGYPNREHQNGGSES